MNLENSFYHPNNSLSSCRLIHLFSVACLFLLGGCCSEENYKTVHPTLGAILVSPDWSKLSAEADPPSTCVVRIGAEEQSGSASSQVFKTLFAPGEQQVLVYNRPSGITINGTQAVVNTKSGEILEEMPGYLFSGVQTAEVLQDDTVRVSVPMKQHIHQLKLTLKIMNGTTADITGTTATISGIASSVSLLTGTLTQSQGKKLIPLFTPTTVAQTRDGSISALTTTVRLLGVIQQEKQILTLNVTLSSGITQLFLTDLTADLITLGDIQKPLELTAILELPTASGTTGTITDWEVSDNGNIDIH